jgi:hypothetical protein
LRVPKVDVMQALLVDLFVVVVVVLNVMMVVDGATLVVAVVVAGYVPNCAVHSVRVRQRVRTLPATVDVQQTRPPGGSQSVEMIQALLVNVVSVVVVAVVVVMMVAVVVVAVVAMGYVPRCCVHCVIVWQRVRVLPAITAVQQTRSAASQFKVVPTVAKHAAFEA